MQENCNKARIDLLKQIESAFANVEAPEFIKISAGSAAQGQEYAYSQAFFGSRRWQDIGHTDVLEKYPSGASAAVTFLSDVGFTYYLPLFMSCSVASFDESGVLLESLLAELAPPETPGQYEQFLIRFSLLDASQKQCVVRFLKFLVTCHSNDLPENIYGRISPKAILSSFWAKVQ